MAGLRTELEAMRARLTAVEAGQGETSAAGATLRTVVDAGFRALTDGQSALKAGGGASFCGDQSEVMTKLCGVNLGVYWRSLRP